MLDRDTYLLCLASTFEVSMCSSNSLNGEKHKGQSQASPKEVLKKLSGTILTIPHVHPAP